MYGIDVKNLNKYISNPKPKKTAWGSLTKIISTNDFSLNKLTIIPDKSLNIRTGKNIQVFYVESGQVEIGKTILKERQLIVVPSNNNRPRR